MGTQTTPTPRPVTPSTNPNRAPAPIRAQADPQPGAPQIKPSATDRDVRHLQGGAQHKPTQQQIERRAYEIWLRRGGGDGNAAVDWLQAERELMSGIDGKNAD